MGWTQERWAASPHCWQSLTVGRQWSCAVSCLGEPCPEPAWQGCQFSTAISPPWFLELWGAEALPGPGEELGTPSPLRVLGVSVVQDPALWADPQAISACIPSEPKPGIILESHWPAERAQGPVTNGGPGLPSAIPWQPGSHILGSHCGWPCSHHQSGNCPPPPPGTRISLSKSSSFLEWSLIIKIWA